MAAQIEVKFKGMSDTGIYCCPCRDVPTLSNLFFFFFVKKKKKVSELVFIYVSVIIFDNRSLTLSDLSAQKRRVWWRF